MYVKNQTFDEIDIGEMASLSHVVTRQDIKLFATMSGDVNPSHLDDEYAKGSHFHKIVAHGMWGGAMISTIIGTKLPGAGSRYISQNLEFKDPILVGDTVTLSVKVIKKHKEGNVVELECNGVNQNGKCVLSGIARVEAPSERISRKAIDLPKITFEENTDWFYKKLLSMIKKKNLPPMPTAVVQPIDDNSLGGVIASVEDNLIEPILIGSGKKIRKVAEENNYDISQFKIIETVDDVEAAILAAEMARDNKVLSIMKGKIHTNDFMSPIVARENGLRTERRMSHVLAVCMPNYHKILFVSDAAVNIAPNLATKKDIVQNSIDLYTRLELGVPKVAVLSAVETVDEQIASTLDATALCKMAERGQIVGGILDGPLAFDNAVSKEAALIKGIVSDVAGDADILIAPDLESGNFIYKQMICFSDVDAAGIVLGAKVPIILTSRAEKPG
nr:bifunctional enoyl-CoA hydratase/phosphate acetyltransferase [Rickettsiaceae bacterium]